MRLIIVESFNLGKPRRSIRTAVQVYCAVHFVACGVPDAVKGEIFNPVYDGSNT